MPGRCLVCLLQGDSDKQIVKRLGISPHTVNQYVKVIYTHFRVESRTGTAGPVGPPRLGERLRVGGAAWLMKGRPDHAVRDGSGSPARQR